MDAAIPNDFWPRLRSENLDPVFIDAACVLADLFARMRLMKAADIEQRYSFADECLRIAQGKRVRNEGSWKSLGTLVETIRFRLAVSLKAHFRADLVMPSLDNARRTSRQIVFQTSLPAYVSSTLGYSEIIGANYCRKPGFDNRDRALALDLVRSTGNASDARVQVGAWFNSLACRGFRLLVAEMVDELFLLIPPNAPITLRHHLARKMQLMAGKRAWLLSAQNFLMLHGEKSMAEIGDPAYDIVSMSRVLLEAGDFAGARDALKIAATRGAESQKDAALLLQTQILWRRRTLQWRNLRKESFNREAYVSRLEEPFRSHIDAFREGSQLLCEGQLLEAEQCFRAARECLGRFVHDAPGTLQLAAVSSEIMSRRTRFLLERPSRRARDLRSCVETLLATELHGKLDQPKPITRVTEYLAVFLEHWARTAREEDLEASIGIALLLRKTVHSSFRSVSDGILEGLARTAPTFFEALCAVVRSKVGHFLPWAPSTRALGSALGLIADLWTDGKGGRGDGWGERGCRRLRFVLNQSESRRVRSHSAAWSEDAAVYSRLSAYLLNASGQPGPAWKELVGYGYLGPEQSRPTKRPVVLSTCWKRPNICDVSSDAAVDSPVTKTGNSKTVRSLRASRRRALASANKTRDDQHAFIGSSEASVTVRRLIETAAHCDYPVLIIGETGVGKEVVARRIHSSSSRGRARMVIADCAATADSLLESELFGHLKGSFTGAHSDHSGQIEKADGSTLFLDEVDSMSPRMQAALLRVLEGGEYRPVGSVAHRRSDFRLISAATPRFAALVESRKFREDLFYRISALRIRIPPLREREGDASEIAVAHGRKRGLALAADALEEIDKYQWPGNVRQLLHCIEVASLFAEDGDLGLQDIRRAIDTFRSSAPRTSSDAQMSEAAGVAWARASETLETMPHFGAWDFARAACVSRRSAQRYLARLLNLGTIARVGAGRATRYRITREHGAS
ncbi:MAG: sigma 54-interacting transcriptional regulator [Planctomycetota bacterium]|jgi:two-component system NtrC family response regulator